MGRRSALTAATIGLALIAATGCGSAASGSSRSPVSDPASGRPVTNPKALVKAILPSDVPEAHLLKVEMETLKDQLAPKYVPAEVAARQNAVVRKSWLASGHALFQLDAHKVAIVVDLNLFRTTSDAAEVYKAERAIMPPAPARTIVEKLPAGAVPESAYRCEGKDGYSGCTLIWRQGAAIAYVALVGKGPSALNPGVGEQLGPRLQAIQLDVAKRIFAQTIMTDGTLRQAA
jgi:hypothetical protein